MSEEHERLLAELSGDDYWRRERAMERLAVAEPSEPLISFLRAALGDDASADRRNGARSALAAMAAPGAAHPSAAIETLEELLAAADADVRLLSAAALGESLNPEAREPLERGLADHDPNVAASAADALGLLGDTRSVPALSSILRAGSFWLSAAAIAALARIGGVEAREAIAGVADDPDLAEMVARALGEIGDAECLDLLQRPLAARISAREAVLEAGASVLASSPGLRPPKWLRAAAAEMADRLLSRPADPIDPMNARLLGILGTEAAAARLVGALCAPGADDSAAIGIGLLPGPVAAPIVLRTLEEAPSAGSRARLLSALPPLGGSDAVHRVAGYLSDPAHEVRAAAAWALGRSDAQVTLPILREVVRDPNKRLWAVRALSRMPAGTVELLDRFLSDADPNVRAAAAEGIARGGAGEVARLGEALHREPDSEARAAMARALGIAGGPAAARELAGLMRSDDVSLRFSAVEALGRTGAAEAFPPLLEALADARPELQAAALYSLGELGDPRGYEPVAARLATGSRDMRRTAAVALHRLAPPEAVERLHAALGDPDREVRLTATRLLERIAGRDSLDLLERAADRDRDPLVRRAACEAVDVVRRRAAETG